MPLEWIDYASIDDSAAPIRLMRRSDPWNPTLFNHFSAWASLPGRIRKISGPMKVFREMRLEWTSIMVASPNPPSVLSLGSRCYQGSSCIISTPPLGWMTSKRLLSPLATDLRQDELLSTDQAPAPWFRSIGNSLTLYFTGWLWRYIVYSHSSKLHGIELAETQKGQLVDGLAGKVDL